MDSLLLLAVIIVAGYLVNEAYKSGKREGSRKGYGVGFDRGRKSKSEGCLLLVLVTGLAISAGGVALTSLIKRTTAETRRIPAGAASSPQ